MNRESQTSNDAPSATAKASTAGATAGTRLVTGLNLHKFMTGWQRAWSDHQEYDETSNRASSPLRKTMTRVIARRPTAQMKSIRAQLLEHIKSCPGLSTRDLAELVGDKSHGCANTRNDLESLGARIKVSGRTDGGFTYVAAVRKGAIVNGVEVGSPQQKALADQQLAAAAAAQAQAEVKREGAVKDYNADAVTGAALVHLIKAGILKVVTT